MVAPVGLILLGEHMASMMLDVGSDMMHRGKDRRPGSNQPVEQPSSRTLADSSGSQRPVDGDQNHAD